MEKKLVVRLGDFGQVLEGNASFVFFIPLFDPLVKHLRAGLKAVVLAAQAIQCGDAEVVAAGGMENMSRAPYMLPDARDGMRLGHSKVVDSMIADGLWDPYYNEHMGMTAEAVCKEYAVDRAAQDELARSFGDAFASAVFALAPGRWSQPIASAYGLHLVLVESVLPGELPPLERVRPRLRAALEEEARDRKLAALLAELRTRYEVAVAEPGEERE